MSLFKKSDYRYTEEAMAQAKVLRENMTKSERHLWYDFLRYHKPRFQRQRPIGPYVVDFVCYDAALVVELDGEAHDSQNAWMHDEARTKYLEHLGFRIIRFLSRDVFENFEGVCQKIECAWKDSNMQGRIT